MTEAEHTRVLCITGMHRSGTSLTASWLRRCGLPIDDGEVYGAASGNQLGVFEDKEFVLLQAQRMRDLVPGSRGWVYTKPWPLQTTDAFRERSAELAGRRSESYRDWGWKDPRSTLFLDHWLEIIPELKVVALWRRAAEVVESLVARSRASDHPALQIDETSALRVWLAYNKCLLKFKLAHPRQVLLFRIDRLLERDREALALINAHLNYSLCERRLSDLYDPNLMNRYPPSWIQRATCRMRGARHVERQLVRASDL